MSESKNIRIFAAFIFLMMALGSGVFTSLFNATDTRNAFKQMGLLVVLIALSFGLAFVLVRFLKLKLKA